MSVLTNLIKELKSMEVMNFLNTGRVTKTTEDIGEAVKCLRRCEKTGFKIGVRMFKADSEHPVLIRQAAVNLRRAAKYGSKHEGKVLIGHAAFLELLSDLATELVQQARR